VARGAEECGIRVATGSHDTFSPHQHILRIFQPITYLGRPPSVSSVTPGSLHPASACRNRLVHNFAQSLSEDFALWSTFPWSRSCSFLCAFPPLCRGYGHFRHLATTQGCLEGLAIRCRPGRHSLVCALSSLSQTHCGGAEKSLSLSHLISHLVVNHEMCLSLEDARCIIRTVYAPAILDALIRAEPQIFRRPKACSKLYCASELACSERCIDGYLDSASVRPP
jgi:hypothetical protein